MSNHANGHHSTQNASDIDHFYSNMNIGTAPYFSGVNYSAPDSNFISMPTDSRTFLSQSSVLNNSGLARLNTGLDSHNAPGTLWDPRSSNAASNPGVLGFPAHSHASHAQHVLPHPLGHHASRTSLNYSSPDPQSPEQLGYTFSSAAPPTTQTPSPVSHSSAYNTIGHHPSASASASASASSCSSSEPSVLTTAPPPPPPPPPPHSSAFPFPSAPVSHPVLSHAGSPQLVGGSSPLSNPTHISGPPLGAPPSGGLILPPSAAAKSAEKRKRSAQLRTASRAKKSKTPTKRDDESNEEARAREMHNHVEQQYRHRLNEQFELLLEALPKQAIYGAPQGSEDGEPDASAGPEKRISKAQVLEIAREYISGLQEENESLRRVMEESGGRAAWN